MNTSKEQYKVIVNYVDCPSKEEVEFRTDRVISILAETAVRLERETLGKKAAKPRFPMKNDPGDEPKSGSEILSERT